MQSLDFWSAVAGVVESGQPVGLVTMVDAEGDGPNRPGAMMAASADGRRIGTVGGGRSEFALAEAAGAALKQSPLPPPRLVSMSHSGREGDHVSGMICSGEQHFVLACLGASDRATLAMIVEACRTGRPCRLTLDAGGLRCAAFSGEDDGVAYDPVAWRYTETIGLRDTMTLVGGGHVSLALTPLLVSLGLRVVVLDDRPNLATMSDNVQADARHVIDYADVGDAIQDGDRGYVAIMTFGHEHDEQVLAQLVSRPFRYLGMMGSAAKIAAIRANLLAQGVSRESLDAVHAPIGLPIASNTPAEIAISIAAQVVAIRNGGDFEP